jgi:hypothetical protein
MSLLVVLTYMPLQFAAKLGVATLGSTNLASPKLNSIWAAYPCSAVSLELKTALVCMADMPTSSADKTKHETMTSIMLTPFWRRRCNSGRIGNFGTEHP